MVSQFCVHFARLDACLYAIFFFFFLEVTHNPDYLVSNALGWAIYSSPHNIKLSRLLLPKSETVYRNASSVVILALSENFFQYVKV